MLWEYETRGVLSRKSSKDKGSEVRTILANSGNGKKPDLMKGVGGEATEAGRG